MDLQTFQPFLHWLSVHTGLAGFFIFLIAFSESLLIVGLIVPGAALIFGVGTLVGAGILNLWYTLIIAFLGAVAGDGVSYLIGKHFHHRVMTWWPFNKHPEILEKGKAYFERHGGKSVLIGRFVGPVRPVIPAVAGMMGMPQSYFFAVNILSALGWAPFYLMPGVVFGSSLALASAIGGRLVVAFLILVAVTLMLAWVVKFIFYTSLPWLQSKFLFWYERSPYQKLVHLLIEDTVAKERGALFFAILITLFVLFIFVFAANAWGDDTSQFDLIVSRCITYFDVPLLHNTFGFIAGVFSWTLMTLLTLNTVVLLLYFSRLSFSIRYVSAIVLSLFTLYCLSILENVWGLNIQQSYTSFVVSIDLVTLIIFVLFVVKVVEQRLSFPISIPAFIIIGLVFFIIVFSFVFTRLLNVSALLLLCVVSCFWGGLLLWGRQISLSREFRWFFSLSSLMFIFVITGLAENHSLHIAREQTKPVVSENYMESAWKNGAWQKAAEYRVGFLGETEQRFNLQWRGTAEEIRQYLHAAHWISPAPLSMKNVLLWLNPKVTLDKLAALPQSHQGQKADLTFFYIYPDEVNRRLALRLWKEKRFTIAGKTVWNASLTEESLGKPGLLTANVEYRQNNALLVNFLNELKTAWDVKVVYDNDGTGQNNQRLLIYK